MPDPRPARLYVVVKDDLSPGQQLAQATHAAFQLAVEHPDRVAEWHRTSNFLVVLAHPDPARQAVLVAYSADTVSTHGMVAVTEPDLPGEPVTAVAFLPAPHVGRALSALPLALKELAMT